MREVLSLPAAFLNMLTPLNANLVHVLLCGAGAAYFTVGLGTVSNTILKKASLV